VLPLLASAAVLVHSSHPWPAAGADLAASSGRAPSALPGVPLGTPRRASVRAARICGHLGILATAPGEKRGLVAAPASDVLRFHTDPDGFITSWLVIGGFPRGTRGRRAAFERDELGGEPSADPRENDPIATGRRLRWRLHAARGPRVDLRRLLTPRRRTAAYAFARLVVPTARRARLLVGSDDGVRAWVNGERVLDRMVTRRHAHDSDLVPIRLVAGVNRLLFKIDQGGGRWAFSARVVDAAGAPMPDLLVELRARGRRARELFPRGLRADLRVDLRRGGSRARLRVRLRAGPPELAGPLVVTVRAQGRSALRQVALRDLAERALEVPLPIDLAPLVRVDVRISDAAGLLWTRRFRRAFPRDLVRLAFAAERDLASARPGAVPQASIDSTTYVLERGRGLLEAGDGDFPYIRRLLTEAARHARAIASGRDPYRTRRQAFYRAYRSPFDGKLQGYAAYVPSSYNPRRAYPLVVALHGFKSTTMITLRRVLGSSIRLLSYAEGDRVLPTFREERFLVAAPRGYGHIAYRYIAEDDILRVIEEMKRAYRIDEDRIYLTGLSMGGLGTMEVGFHFPDRFAGLISNCGAADTRLYESVEGYTPTSWETDLIEGRSAVLWAENGLHLPFTIAHGLRDPINHPRNSRVLVEEYRRLGYRVWSRFDPDLGHNVWDRTYEGGRIWTRFLRFKRDRYPARVVFKSAHYRYRTAYWVRLEEFDRLWKFARVDARIDSAANAVRVETQNLLRFALDVSGPRLSRARPLRITVDGQMVVDGPWEHREVVLWRERASDPWRARGPGDGVRSGKRPGLSGPIEDFKYVRQILVYGTQDPEEARVLRRAAEEASTYHSHAAIRLEVKRDVDVTEADLRNAHLHLFGTARSNLWLRKVEASLPVRLEGNGVRVGSKVFRGDDVGFKLIYPNPLAPDRYILVSAGVSAHAARWANWLPLWTPDYVVYDQRTVAPRGGKILAGRPVRAAGTFDKAWRLEGP
jgi:predicted esterase